MDNEQYIHESSIKCRHCDSMMSYVTIKKHPGNWPYILAGLGLFFTFFLVGPIIGVPLFLIGLYMARATETVNLCESCGYFFKAHLPADDRNSVNS